MRDLLSILLLFCNDLILNPLSKLEKRETIQGLFSLLSFFHNELKIKNIIARTLDSIYQIKLKLFCPCVIGMNTSDFVIVTRCCYQRHSITVPQSANLM